MLIELMIVGGGTALWNKEQSKRSKHLVTILQQTTINKKHTSKVQQTKRLLGDLKSAIWGDERQQLQQSLDPTLQAEAEQRRQAEQRKFLLSAGATGLAILGTVFPAFYLLGSAAVLYLGIPIMQIVLRDLRQKHFISVQLVSVILMIGMIATGQIVLAAFAGLVGGFLAKLIRKAEENSQKQLINVFGGHPTHIWLEKDGVELEVPFDSVRKNDIVVVHAGEIIPVDGSIQAGSASIDQHILTGESQPVHRTVGEKVFAATLILAGRISILVETAGEETVAANIGHVLNNTKSYKDHLMLRGKKIADRLLPIEFGVSALTLGLLGPIPAMAILWSGLGYRMIMYGPISVLNYLQILARQGILVKDGRVLESLRNIDTIVFDKTGTLTHEQPSINCIHVLSDSYTENHILQAAASAEHRQPHPVAKAIVEKAQAQGILPEMPEEIRYEVGYGVSVSLHNQVIRIGSARFLQREGLVIPSQVENLQQQADQHGHSLIYVGIDQTVAGILEMEPSIRPEVPSLIKALKRRGITTYIISGDHEQPTRTMAQRLGVDHYFAETLPENKAQLINQLRDQGKFVCFIGDGINDTIALKSAHISISLKGASSAATDTAQIIFMDGSLTPLTTLLQLADEFEQTMRNNLVLSLAPGLLNMGGVYLLHFGIAASMGLFYAGTTAGLANTVLPLIKHQESRPQLNDPLSDQP